MAWDLVEGLNDYDFWDFKIFERIIVMESSHMAAKTAQDGSSMRFVGNSGQASA